MASNNDRYDDIDLVSALEELFADDEQDPEDWPQEAVCKETDPEAFFPEKGGSTREAKKICMGCPVRIDCLHAALEHDERFGIWGGLSERERRKLKKNAVTPAALYEALEQSVEELTADGYSEQELGPRLGISIRTLRQIKAKLATETEEARENPSQDEVPAARSQHPGTTATAHAA